MSHVYIEHLISLFSCKLNLSARLFEVNCECHSNRKLTPCIYTLFLFFLCRLSLPFYILDPCMLFLSTVSYFLFSHFSSSMSVKIELMLIESEHDTATFWVKGYIILKKDPIKFLLVVNAQLWLKCILLALY